NREDLLEGKAREEVTAPGGPTPAEAPRPGGANARGARYTSRLHDTGTRRPHGRPLPLAAAVAVGCAPALPGARQGDAARGRDPAPRLRRRDRRARHLSRADD